MSKKRINLGPLFTGNILSAADYLLAQKKSASESDIQVDIVRELQLHGYMVIRINSGASKRPYTTKDGKQKFSWIRNYIIYGLDKSKSFPDLLAIRGDGTPEIKGLLIECKKYGKDFSPDQKAFADYCKRLGITVHLFACWQDARNLLTTLQANG